MADGHQRYERLAVGHVVGGLDEVDAARFRSHLVACRDCRSRVAELRGIASDLVATEREERAAGARGRTELAERVEEQAPPRSTDVAPVTSWPWRVVAIGLVPLVVLGVLAWAVYVRAANTVLGAAVVTQTAALEVLADGEVLDAVLEPGVTGVVAATGDRVVVNLSAIPEPAADQEIRAHLLDGAGERVRSTARITRGTWRGEMLRVLELPDDDAATAVVVTLEQLPAAGAVEGPVTGLELVRASLPAPTD